MSTCYMIASRHEHETAPQQEDYHEGALGASLKATELHAAAQDHSCFR